MEAKNAELVDKPKLRGDLTSLLLLTFLYVLQGVPYGLSLAVPLILQRRKITYADQAGFSLAQCSFCMKIIWAPIIDCVFSKKMGRRKTWLIPSQYMIGVILLIISVNVDNWLGSEDGTRKPNVLLLTFTFFLCIFFASTQDVAVDGWSLTMLKKRNIGHASSCSGIGYAFGQFASYFLFIILSSKDFANTFRSIPGDEGFVSIASFIQFWAVVFFASTTLVLLFKRDNSLDVLVDGDSCRMGLKESYQHLWKICHLEPVQTLAIMLITCQVIFGPVQGVTPLKLIDAGVPPDKVVWLAVPSLPFQFILPFALGNLVTGPRSMRAFMTSYLLKCIVGLCLATFMFTIPYVKDENKDLPPWFYWVLLIVYNVDNLVMYVVWIAALAFFSRVSDPRFGGMYLTILNTVSNIGYYWPVSTCLGLLDLLTIKSCVSVDTAPGSPTCTTVWDGYYTEVIFCTLFGFMWTGCSLRHARKLEKLDLVSWRVDTSEREEIKEKEPITRHVPEEIFQ